MTYTFISFAVLLILLIIVPLILSLIYKHFYNRHINRKFGQVYGTDTEDGAITSASPVSHSRKWLAPIAVFLLVFAVEILILVLMCVMSMLHFRHSDEYMLDSSVCAMTEIDASGSYSEFNGSNVDGYKLTEKDDGNFICQIYEKTDDSSTEAAYIIRVAYTGTQTIQSWDDNLYVGERGIGSMGDFADSNYTIYTIIYDNALYGDGIELTINLYAEAMDDYSDAMGTYPMPDPAETFTTVIR